ncbi:unnamed protein product [Pieris brassicae]|uniref:Uncharacterized protein n=1 Tax=Pieris brassicae TaxID=7116 RepID=A0A9P0THQ1_PIEBR|nr:unnamed protein product [Pieris brassicae]
MLRASIFVRLQIAQRRNFFERGVNTVRWARLRHCHSAISLVFYFLSPKTAISLTLAQNANQITKEMSGALRARTSRTKLRARLT